MEVQAMRRCFLIAALTVLGFSAYALVEPSSAIASMDSTVYAQADDDSGEGASDPDRSPLEDLNPAQSTWKVWIGPIILGVFGLILLFVIRRFSLGGRNRPVRDDDRAGRKRNP
jgi:hypothetical protein